MSKPAPNVMGRARGPRMGGPVEKPKDRKGTLRRIWRYLKNERAALICFCSICHNIDVTGTYSSLFNRSYY